MTICDKPTCEEFLIINELVRQRDDYTCQLCGEKYYSGKAFPVHHIHYDPDRCFTDLITLCDLEHRYSSIHREEYERRCMKILEIRGLLNWKNELKIKMVDAAVEPNHPVKPWYKRKARCGKCPYNI